MSDFVNVESPICNINFFQAKNKLLTESRILFFFCRKQRSLLRRHRAANQRHYRGDDVSEPACCRSRKQHYGVSVGQWSRLNKIGQYLRHSLHQSAGGHPSRSRWWHMITWFKRLINMHLNRKSTHQ